MTTYNVAKLKVAKGTARPRPAVRELPPLARSILQNHEVYIAKDTFELEALDPSEVPARPYWDPALWKSRRSRMELLGVLAMAGPLGLRRTARSKVSFFFVKTMLDPIRLIMDCRVTNSQHKEPPATRLASASCCTELDLADGRIASAGYGDRAVHGQEGDVAVCFYNFLIDDLSDWFAVDEEPMTAAAWQAAGVDLRLVYEDGRWEEPDPTEKLFVTVRVMSMGWSWALYLARDLRRQHHRPRRQL